jgi:hypothetical protein
MRENSIVSEEHTVMPNLFRIKQVFTNKSNPSETTLIKQDEIHIDESRTEFQFEFNSKKLRLEVTLPTKFIMPILSLAKQWAIPILAGSYLTLLGLNPNFLRNPVPLSPQSSQVTPQPK